MRTWKTSLDHLSPASNRICRELLAPLWADARPRDFADLDEVQRKALALLVHCGYVVKDRADGTYTLGERAYLE
ncbi:hypothetical protein [Streptomyces sp. NPDC007984]|uniref:hypothetical protein n=1 Tax=Streptomyces sp. NPDC007984 TaxID=3364801 RepID=UPI0036EAF06E